MAETPQGNSIEQAKGLFARIPLLVWVLICAGLWGSAFPVIKLVYAHWAGQGVESDFANRSLFAGVRFTVAGLFLLLLSKQPLAEWKLTPLYWILALAATQTLGQYVFFYYGLNYASGALASILVATGSFWWVILAPLILRAPATTWKQWLILLLGAVGVTLAVYAPGAGSGQPAIGALLIIIANLFGALGMIVFQFVRRTMGARAGTGFSLFIGGVVFLMIGYRAYPDLYVLFDGYVCLLTAWLAFVSAVAFALWNHLSTLYPVQMLATFRFLIPVAGVIESVLILEGENLSLNFAVGGLIVIAAMILSSRTGPQGGKRVALKMPS